MPFTFSHPIGALPFKAIKPKWFSTTGLVIGSMCPDFEYFLKREGDPTISETLWGVFLFNLPIAIITAFTYHLFIKAVMIRHLPAPFDKRLSGFIRYHFLTYLSKHWFIFIASTIIGIGSHLFLDWITSPKGVLDSIEPLHQKVSLVGVELSYYRLMERAISIIGLIVIAYLVLRLNKPKPNFERVKPGKKWLYWILISVVTTLLIVVDYDQLERFTGILHLIIISISSFMIALISISILFVLLKKRPAKS